MSRGLMLLMILGFGLASPLVCAAGDTLQSVQLKTRGATTMVHFDVDNAPRVDYFSLDDPPRAVIDFHGTRAGDIDSVTGGAVRGLRLAQHDDGRLRVVLDLVDGASLGDVTVGGDDVEAIINGAGQADTSTAAKSTSASISSDGARAGNDKQPKAQFRAAAENGPLLVVIDPGHGGHDSGARAASGLSEKTVTLAVAKQLYAKLKATRHIHPVLTRDDDTFVTLRQRVKVAQKRHANLFISIHANSYKKDKSVKGATCFILSRHGASDAKAAQLAHFENSSDRSLAGVDFSADPTLNAVLTDLYQNASIEHANDLSQGIIAEFAKVGPIYRHKPPRANFAVLRDPMIPSVLCETAFLSNPHQARLMASTRFQKQLADAIYRGVMTYFREHPPERMQPAGGSVYTVKAGDTLSQIAGRRNVSVNALMDINHLQTKTLRIGQKLELPGG